MDFSSFTDPQKDAIKHLDGPLLVCAGAGTGKTFTLANRIAWALAGDPEQGIPPFLDSIDNALVITYTDKAAAELKGRFRTTLRSVGKFEDALKVDGAWISTIHGMCSRILREHALEVDIDPEFQLVIGADEQLVLKQAINNAIHDPKDSQHFQPLFDEYGTNGVSNMVEKVIEQAACQTAGMAVFNLGPKPKGVSPLLRETVDAAAFIAETGKPGKKTTAKAQVIFNQLNDFMLAGGSEADLLDLLDNLDCSRLFGKGAPELKGAFNALRDNILLNSAYGLEELLLELSCKVDELRQRILQEKSQVTTSDLIRMTLTAFDEHPEIAQQYTSRFKLIMVDEFQDTSQLQIDMIERIAGKGKTHLCTVGDSQQSIYRFQGADVGVYLKHKHDMLENGAKLVELQDNFRSNADILAFVRTVCGKPGYFIEPFLDLNAASKKQNYHGSAPRVEVSLTLYDNFKGASDAAALQEARHIAQRFRTLINEGHAPSDMVILMGAATKVDTYAAALREQGIPYMKTGGKRYFEGEHVKRCISLLNVLANPYDSTSMLDVLSSEMLPVSSNDLLLLATYLNEETGLPTRQNFASAFLYADRAPKECSPLLEHAMQVLKRAWRKLGYVRPSKLFLETVLDSGWFDRLANEGGQGQAKVADIVKMSRLVADAEKDAGFDMTRVAARIQAAVSEGEKPGVLSVEGLEAVRLMTAHSSKGLEFPIVAITSCYTSLLDNGPLRCESEGGVVYLSLAPKEAKLASELDFDPDKQIELGNSENLVEHRAKIAEESTRRAEAERRRLFYVAATRATDALIVAVTKKQTTNLVYKEVEANLLDALFPGRADFPESGTFEYGGSEPGTFTRMKVHKPANEQPVEAEGKSESVATYDAPRAAGKAPAAVAGTESTLADPETHSGGILLPVLEDTPAFHVKPLPRRTGFFSYSSIAPHDAGKPAAREYDPDANGDENVAAHAPADADKATDFGSALHRTCEWIALQPQTPSEEAVRHAALRFGSQWGVRNTRRLIDGVMRWFESAIAAHAFEFATHQPEVPFCTTVGGGYLEGEIDLFCTNGNDHAFIVDYKTGGNDAETPDQLQHKHQLQAMCYAFVALRAGYRSVELHFVRVERADEQDPSQPQVVSYAFDSTDMDNLENAIEKTQAAANAQAG